MVTPQQTYAARLEIDYPDGLDRVSTLSASSHHPDRHRAVAGQRRRDHDHGHLQVGRGDREDDEHRWRHRRWAVRRHRADDPLPAALPALVVRLPASVQPLRDPCRRLPRSAHRPATPPPRTSRPYTSTWTTPTPASGLNRWLPLVKWLLALPHYVVLLFLGLGAVVAVVIAWFAILFTGRYPRALFDYVVGVGRWALRVQAYAFLLLTDTYPPFSLR